MKKKVRQQRHCFRYKIIGPNGKAQIIEQWAKVIVATQPVALDLAADHTRRSIDLKGAGNLHTCTMAICSDAQADRFPHPVVGGIDWQYRTAFVPSKLNRLGFITECYGYQHHDSVARVNDSIGGQRKLLAQLEKFGDRKVTLLPMENRADYNAGKGKNRPSGGKKKGKRNARIHTAKGGKLRFAITSMENPFSP